MAQRFIRVEWDVALPVIRGEDEKGCLQTNWDLCTLCQTDN